MNGRVYDPLLARFGTPDPMMENPFSTQGRNRYSYVDNSPVSLLLKLAPDGLPKFPSVRSTKTLRRSMGLWCVKGECR